MLNSNNLGIIQLLTHHNTHNFPPTSNNFNKNKQFHHLISQYLHLNIIFRNLNSQYPLLNIIIRNNKLFRLDNTRTKTKLISYSLSLSKLILVTYNLRLWSNRGSSSYTPLSSNTLAAVTHNQKLSIITQTARFWSHKTTRQRRYTQMETHM